MSRLTRLRAFKWPTIAYEVLKNLRSRLRERRGHDLRAITPMGSSLGDPAERVAYSRRALDLYLGRSGLAAADMEGKRVLELGPGEELCVALRFLALGAAGVSCIDRFKFKVDESWEREVYRLLLDDLDADGRERLADMLTPDGRLDHSSERLKVVRGVGIEAGARHLGSARFDLIVSLAVLEHVYDLAQSLRAMDTLLAPGGVMVHQVDLRDHGMFSAGGRHPLEFLTLRGPLYHLMTSHTGAPNRERVGNYRELLRGLGHEAKIGVTNVGGGRDYLTSTPEQLVVGRDLPPELAQSIERLRPRLVPPFAGLPVEELAATAIVIRSRKPSVPG
jgi:SAM-dependent methyltransferase